MNAASDIEAELRRRITRIGETAPGSIGDILHFSLLECTPESGEYLFCCQTEDWMRNFGGTLHGGIGATILDQAMGFVAYCLIGYKGMTPTVQLSVNYHRPLIPGAAVLVRVRVISVTRSLITLSAEASQKERPDKICLSGTGLYFLKSAN